jgi:hypothetical protein
MLRYSPNCFYTLINEASFLQGLDKNKDRELAYTFNSIVRCIDVDLSLNNSRFSNYLHLIYPNELEVKYPGGAGSR